MLFESFSGLAQASKSSQLIELARQLNLSENLQWYRLNHYRKEVWGGYRSTIRGDFFINEQGGSDAKAELEATLDRMFSDNLQTRKKYQCRYLARRDFLVNALQISHGQLELCEFSVDWLKRLGAQKISLIFASSYMNSAASSFGHTFLKLNNPDNQGGLELVDYGLNFSARTPDADGPMYAINGLFGNYPGAYNMLPFHQMMKDYINLEGRDIWEYELNLTPEETRRLIYAVLELEGTYFDYYFLDDNCSFQVLKLLEIARPELNLAAENELFMIPLDSLKRINSIDGLVKNRIYRPSLQRQFREYQKKFDRGAQLKIKEFFDSTDNSKRPNSSLVSWTTEELNLAQIYVDLMRLSDSRVYKSKRDDVARTRAHRVNVEIPDLKTPLSPEGSPDSSSTGLGYFESEGRMGQEFALRFAFHDLLEPDIGAASWSHLEVLGLRWRFEDNVSKNYIRDFSILDILSTSPVSPMFQPISWGVRLGGFQNGDDLNHLSLLFQMKVGNSLDIYPDLVNGLESWLRWSLFAKGAMQESPDLRYTGGVGIESFFLINPVANLRSQFGGENLYFANTWNLLRMYSKAIYTPAKNLELLAEWSRTAWQNSSKNGPNQVDKLIRIQYQFLY